MAYPHTNRVLIALAVVILAVLWQQVFAMTGLLWWNADAPATKAPRPKAPVISPPPSEWVDVDAYLRTHPVWQPGG